MLVPWYTGKRRQRKLVQIAGMITCNDSRCWILTNNFVQFMNQLGSKDQSLLECMYHRNSHDTDDGFGNSTASCLESTLPRAYRDSVVILTNMESKCSFSLHGDNNNVGGDWPRPNIYVDELRYKDPEPSPARFGDASYGKRRNSSRTTDYLIEISMQLTPFLFLKEREKRSLPMSTATNTTRGTRSQNLLGNWHVTKAREAGRAIHLRFVFLKCGLMDHVVVPF